MIISVLAKAGDWITILVMVVGFFVWLATQIASQSAKRAAQQRRRTARPAPPPPRPRRPAPPPVRRAVSESGRPTPIAPSSTPSRRQARPTPPRPRRPTPPPRRPSSAPPAPTTAGEPLPERKISSLENRHLDTTIQERKVSTIEQRHLKTSVPPAEAAPVPHVEEVFSHQLGELLISELRPETVHRPTALSPLAQDIVNMLRSPQDVRKAVVVAEILRRPEF